MMICKGCGREFVSKHHKDFCRTCRRVRMIYKEETKKKVLKKLFNSTSELLFYYKDIRILLIKGEAGILDSIDCFIIASIYVEVFQNHHAFSSYPPMKQAELMLFQLKTLIKEKNLAKN